VLALASAFTVVGCSVDVALLCAEIQVVLIDNPTLSLSDRVLAYNELPWILPASFVQILFTGSADSGLLYILNDFLASWRAISIWRSRRSSVVSCKSVLYILLFSTCVFWIASAVLHWSVIGHGIIPNSDPPAIIPLVGSATSIATNLLATFMTGYTTYGHVALVSRAGAGMGRVGARILLLLTESGLIYAIIQIIRFALTISIVPSTPVYGSLFTAAGIFQSATTILTAMYTPALILIVHHGYSATDSMQLGSISAGSGEGHGSLRSRPMSRLVFAHGSSEGGVKSDIGGDAVG
jgi:hypothetical protein